LGPRLQSELLWGFCRLRVEAEAVGKREGPVTLSSSALGPTSSSEEDTDEDVSQPPPHLMVPVDLRIGSGNEKYYPYLALVDSSAM
jgi:hypothetical protein